MAEESKKKLIKKATSYEDLIEEALNNAVDDRERAVDAFEKTKEVYNIDFTDQATLQATMSGLMLLGQSIPKLLELANKSNEQIIKLAQLREKEACRTDKGTKQKDDNMINMEEVRSAFKGLKEEN